MPVGFVQCGRDDRGGIVPDPCAPDRPAVPLGWIPAPSYESLLHLIRHPVTRIYLFVLISLPLFHGAHRFRYTLYDGLKLKHLTLLIVIMCYGSALLGTVAAAVLLWRIP